MIKRHAVIKSLMEHQKFMGVDRELGMFMILLLVAINLCAISFSVFILSCVLFAICYMFLYAMAKHDLLLRKIYLRSLKYRSFYTAQALMFSKYGYKK